MEIDYILDIPCEPKRRFGVEGLISRLRLLARFQERGSLSEREEEAARTAVFELRPVAFHCAKCPANHRNHEFGCYGQITGPISAEAEEWLIDLLPLSLRPREPLSPEHSNQIQRVQQLLETLREWGFTGKPVDDRRPKSRRVSKRNGATPGLLELPQAVVRKYGSLMHRTRLTSSQLLHYLLFYGQIKAADAEAICRALGVWQDGGLGEDGMPEVIFTQPVNTDDDPSVEELKRFFLALLVACSLNTAVRTDLSLPGENPGP